MDKGTVARRLARLARYMQILRVLEHVYDRNYLQDDRTKTTMEALLAQ